MPRTAPPTADAFVATLLDLGLVEELPAFRARVAAGGDAPGTRMRDLFDAAKAAQAMPLDEVATLFADDRYQVRLGAVCILDFRAKAKRATDDERRELYGLYLGHHDRITTWDMVDRAAPSVVGGYLAGRSVAPLHELAASADPIRRRTAITAPLWFVRYGSDADLHALFPLAAALAADPDPLVHKAVGIALKHAGGRAPDAVAAFLDEHAPAMARPAVRYAAEKLDAAVRARFIR